MKEYLVLRVLKEEEGAVLEVMNTLLNLLKEDKGEIVYIGSLEKARSIAKKTGIALPFSSFVDNFNDLLESKDRKERFIFYNLDKSEKNGFEIATHIMDNSSCVSYLTLGDHEKYYSKLVMEALPNVLMTLVLSEDGLMIFPYPRSLEITRESLIDTLINVDSITNNPFFNQGEPFVLIKEKRSDIAYDSVMKIAEKLNMHLELSDDIRKIDKDKCRAVLTFSDNFGNGQMRLFFGLPFYYMNQKDGAKDAILHALRITKVISRGSL